MKLSVKILCFASDIIYRRTKDILNIRILMNWQIIEKKLIHYIDDSMLKYSRMETTFQIDVYKDGS